jgi:4-hydroxy-tetrahydrodipicolinate reductase
MTTLAIFGAAGRMGGVLIRCAGRTGDLKVVAALETEGHPQVGQDAGTRAGLGALGLRIGSDLRAAAAADVWIDFTFHTATPKHAELAAEAGKAIVIGTTGLTAEETGRVHAAAERVPVVWAPSMSLAVNLLFAMTQKAAALLGADYDIEIIEMHHHHKKDAPSGTALRLAEKAAAGRRQTLSEVVCFGREGQVGERPAGQIGIHAVRAGDVVGEHTVLFAAPGERLELTCRATSRDPYAIGAMHAARWVYGRKPGLYDMQDVLGLKESV